MPAELVRDPVTSSTSVDGTAALTYVNIDYTSCSRVEPILKSNTSTSERDYGCFSSEGTSVTPWSTAFNSSPIRNK